jgi:hypothetical protein
MQLFVACSFDHGRDIRFPHLSSTDNRIAVVANMFFVPLGILFHTDVCDPFSIDGYRHLT